jgi:hypothetical protein
MYARSRSACQSVVCGWASEPGILLENQINRTNVLDIKFQWDILKSYKTFFSVKFGVKAALLPVVTCIIHG